MQSAHANAPAKKLAGQLARLTAIATLLATLPAISGCAATFPSYRDFPGRAPALTSDATEHDNALAVSEELSGRFYAPDADLVALEPDVMEALRTHPGVATLHEMAAHLAELHQDAHGAFWHWLSAAADLDGNLSEIYLDLALARDLTASEKSAAMVVLQALIDQHPRPSMRVDATRRLIGFYEERGRFEEATHLGETLDFIDQWKVLGSFDNDQMRGFLTAYPPESGIDLDAEVQGMLLPLRWRDASLMDRRGMVRIGDMVSPDGWAVAYLLTHAQSASAQDAELRLTSPQGVRVWVNGRLVASDERIGRAATDNIVVPIHLEAGYNQILLKSAHDDEGAWRVGARITALGGESIEGLSFDAALHDHPELEEGPGPAERSPMSEALDGIESPLRRALLSHHDSIRSGFEGDALNQARTMLQLAPRHPAVLYHGAMTHWSNEEMGQAIDLLNAGVEVYPTGAGFLWQRGSFYRERDRYDRAIEDLNAALELNADARFVRMELSATFEDRGWHEHQCVVLDEVLRRWPDSSWGIRAQAHCMQTRGYLARAQDLYLRADALAPGHGWNIQRLATMARWRQDHDTAMQLADRLVALAPWSVENLVKAGDHYRWAGRPERARALYQQAASFDPAWANPAFRLGLLAFEAGDRDTALTQWASALERDPDDSALANRVDFLRGDEADPERRLMPSDADIEQALADAATIAPHPGAHSILVLDDEVTTIQQDGSSMRRITQVYRALTTDGRDSLIRNQVPANARILAAYSVSPEGARQEASSIRGGAVRFRGLSVGSGVVMQYVYHAQPPAFLPNHFVSSWLFQGLNSQVGHARWVVQAPAGRQLAMHVQGAVQHRVETHDGMDVHTFTAENMPPLVPEPQMPPPGDLLALVTLSTLTDWAEYARWERALLSEVFESNAQLSELAHRLTEGADTPREKLDRLYHYVAQEIRYQQDYETTIAGVRPHSCPVVLERGYGDCKDKAVLMILLARELGLEVRFAVLRTTSAGRVRRDVPNQQFNHAIAYVPAQEGIEEGFFMDPTTDLLDMGNLRADDQGALSLVLDPDTGEHEFHEIPYQSPERQYFGCEVELNVAGAGDATAGVECTIRGSAGSVFRRLMRNEERAGQLYQNVANNLFAGATVSSRTAEHEDDIWQPLELGMQLDASAAIQPEGDNLRVRVPSPFTLAQSTRLAERQTPLRFGPPSESLWQISFQAPAGGRIVRTPEDFRLEHACFEISRETEVRGRRATVSVRFRRTCTEVSPEDYPSLRQVAQQAVNQLQAHVLIAP